MKQIIRTALAIMGITTLATVGIAAPSYAQFEGGLDNGIEMARGSDQPREIFNGNEGDLIGRITNLLLFIVGVISVFMLIVGGFKFILSGGNKEKVTAARNTILYALVGLVIAFFSFAIVEFVMEAISGGGMGGNW